MTINQTKINNMTDAKLIELIEQTIKDLKECNLRITRTLPHCSEQGKILGMLSIRLNNAQIANFTASLNELKTNNMTQEQIKQGNEILDKLAYLEPYVLALQEAKERNFVAAGSLRVAPPTGATEQDNGLNIHYEDIDAKSAIQYALDKTLKEIGELKAIFESL